MTAPFVPTRPVCPECHAHFLVWDDEVGQWYCSHCDMHFSDEDLAEQARQIAEMD